MDKIIAWAVLIVSFVAFETFIVCTQNLLGFVLANWGLLCIVSAAAALSWALTSETGAA